MKFDSTSRLRMYYGADSKTMEAASILRKNMTVPELILRQKLKDRTIFKCKFRRQHPVSFFIVDFYFHEYKLVVEVDGEIHNDETAREYDLGRTAELNKFGLKVLRFTNSEVLENIDSVLKKIDEYITDDTPFRGQGV
jgi:very-short-patch-repair endonuclease